MQDIIVDLHAMGIITKSYIKNSFTYEEYRQMGKDLIQKGLTTGSIQNEDMLQYSRLNDKRMDRLDKSSELSEETQSFLRSIRSPQYWVVITELWCGDAAQALPLIHKMASHNTRIHLRLLLRDENPEIMDAYLTNGSRSIPKLILLNESLEEKGVWGPRPAPAQVIMQEWKDAGGGDKSAMLENVQRWYLEDKGKTTEQEIMELLSQ